MSLEMIDGQADARALQLRLYRELGVAAVAAALGDGGSDRGSDEAQNLTHTPAIVAVENDCAIAA